MSSRDRATWDRRDFLKGLLATPLLLAGCGSAGIVTETATGLAVGAGVMDQGTASAMTESAYAIQRTFEDITPSQEYYIGRSVGAVVLSRYQPLRDESATRYVNLLGATLAQASARPETFGGYHFMLLDSDDINGLAAPGGLIFITRGLLRCCETEDALAGVLAHEIAHVAARHGLQAIEKSRITEAVISVGNTTAKVLDAGALDDLTEAFGGSVDDIARTMITSGYSRSMERDADHAAVKTCERVGYSPAGLVAALERMSARLEPGAQDFASTHPSAADRIDDIEQAAPKMAALSPHKARSKRFAAAFAGIG